MGVWRWARGASKRLPSLDTFRGLTIVLMLLVNNAAMGTHTPEQLRHAGWGQGVHLADLVFPWFLLIAGLSIPMAVAAHYRRHLSRRQWVGKVVTRTAVLLALGCLVDSSVKGSARVDLGVLQLIGLAYCVAALCAEKSQGVRLSLAAALLTAHYLLLRLVPVPGVAPAPWGETTNLVTYLNETYLKALHVDGLLSMVSTAGLVVLGTVFGDALRREEGISRREIGYLFASGAVLSALGWGWSHAEPFSKPLWTSSYLLVTGGMGLMVLAFFRLAVDTCRWRTWVGPLRVFGANALVVYVGGILVKTLILQRGTCMLYGRTVSWLQGYHLLWMPPEQIVDGVRRFPFPNPDGGWGDLLARTLANAFHINVAARVAGAWGDILGYIAVWWLITAILYRRRWFVRI